MENHQVRHQEQLDATLARFAPRRDTPPPRKEWIRAIQDALGMSGVPQGEVRAAYLDALRAANKGEYSKLTAFVRSQ